MGSRTARVALVAIAAALFGLGQVDGAWAATGDVRADIAAPSGGVGVAFDGANLYYTDLNGTELRSVTPAGVAGPSVPIVGAPGITALTYDVTHDFFWAVDTTGLGIYQLTRDGRAWLQFALVPGLDLPGLCDVATGCSTTVSGLAYDATNDTLWYAPMLSQRVYHLTTAGELHGWFDTNELGSSLFPECAANGVGGIAAGKDSLYLSAGACGRGYRFGKSDAQAAPKLGSFAMASQKPGDVECDNVSFSATVIWVRDTVDGHLRAFEVAPGTCAFGGGMSVSKAAGWMSGGGASLNELAPIGETFLTAQHAFHLLCAFDPDAPSNNLVINWKDLAGNHLSFHLTEILTVSCGPLGNPSPPPCDTLTETCNNTIIGTGLGRLRKRSSGGQLLIDTNRGFVDFMFQDNGEPHQVGDPADENPLFDIGQLSVSTSPDPSDPTRETVLTGCGCARANYQAHANR